MLFIYGIVQALLFSLTQTAPAGLSFEGKGAGFAEFQAWDFSEQGTLSFMFQTTNTEGTLLYHDAKTGREGYMLVQLDPFSIYLQFYLPFCWKETVKLKVDGSFYSDNQWHDVSVFLGYENVTLTVDGIMSTSHPCSYEIPKIIAKRRRRWQNLSLGGAPILLRKQSDWALPNFRFIWQPFVGCIGNLMYKKGAEKAYRAKLKYKKSATYDCENACDGSTQMQQCDNGGKCIDHIKTFECDCEGTGYEGPKCADETSFIYLNGSGYISFENKVGKKDWSMKNNRVSFRMVAKKPNGVIFYMGDKNDHLLIELVDSRIRVDVNLGGGSLKMVSNVTLNMSTYYWVQVLRRQREVTLDINLGWYKLPNMTRNKQFSLDLSGDNRVAYVAGGPGLNDVPFSVSKQNFSGFLQQFEFENYNIIDQVQRTKTDTRFKKNGYVPNGWLYRILLPSRDNPTGSGCGEGGDDDEDDDRCQPTECVYPECVPESTTVDPDDETLTTPNTRSFTRQTYATPSGGGVLSQVGTPPDHSVSTLVIVIIVIAAVVAVIITVFLLYRWNNRYSGSFKPSKGEPDTEAEIPPLRGYEQPAFYVSPNKPPKGETI